MKKLFVAFLLICLSTSAYSQSVSRKSKKHFVLDWLIGDTTEYSTPYYILRTEKKEYPKILIDGGIHGDEIAGVMAIDTVMKYINITRGTVVFVPKVNIQAVNKNTRQVNVDLNHVFPGNSDGSLYEERLAYDFMKFVEEIKPDVVINLHEAWNRFDDYLYELKKDKSFGQTFITNSEQPSDFLKNVLNNVNSFIPDSSIKFRIQYFPFKPNHSMDNIIARLNIPSYTVETLRTLPLNDRIGFQITCILAFIEESGVKFKYFNPN